MIVELSGYLNDQHYRIGEIVLNRQTKFWLQPDLIFKFTNDYTRHENCIKILHCFSNRVIRERKAQISQIELKKQQENEFNNNNNNNDDFTDLNITANGNITKHLIDDEEETFGKKKKLAFLDLLIQASGNGTVLTDKDIRFVCKTGSLN